MCHDDNRRERMLSQPEAELGYMAKLLKNSQERRWGRHRIVGGEKLFRPKGRKKAS